MMMNMMIVLSKRSTECSSWKSSPFYPFESSRFCPFEFFSCISGSLIGTFFFYFLFCHVIDLNFLFFNFLSTEFLFNFFFFVFSDFQFPFYFHVLLSIYFQLFDLGIIEHQAPSTSFVIFLSIEKIRFKI